MKQLEMIRRVCYPVRLRARTPEHALSAVDICEMLIHQDLRLSPDQVEKMMNYVVTHEQNFIAENGRYYYVSRHHAYAG